MPEPLANLVLSLANPARDNPTDAGPPPSWLFPGRRPDQPISTGHLLTRLHRLGIHPRQSRSAALFQLATELPAAIIARTLGIHINAATRWQRASAGDWTSYAADVSRRETNH